MSKNRFQQLAGLKESSNISPKNKIRGIIRESLNNLREDDEDQEELEDEGIEDEGIEEPTTSGDPIKQVQDALSQAQSHARELDDEKLLTQIGNTLTYFVRTHVANASPEEDGEDISFPLDDEEIE